MQQRHKSRFHKVFQHGVGMQRRISREVIATAARPGFHVGRKDVDDSFRRIFHDASNAELRQRTGDQRTDLKIDPCGRAGFNRRQPICNLSRAARASAG
jgi:hypothetical protein